MNAYVVCIVATFVVCFVATLPDKSYRALHYTVAFTITTIGLWYAVWIVTPSLINGI